MWLHPTGSTAASPSVVWVFPPSVLGTCLSWLPEWTPWPPGASASHTTSLAWHRLGFSGPGDSWWHRCPLSSPESLCIIAHPAGKTVSIHPGPLRAVGASAGRRGCQRGLASNRTGGVQTAATDAHRMIPRRDLSSVRLPPPKLWSCREGGISLPFRLWGDPLAVSRQ